MSKSPVPSRHSVDPFRFAAEGRSIGAEIVVGRLERLVDVVVDDSAALVFRLEGSLDASRNARLDLFVQGELTLRCQRCLAGLQWPVDIRVALQPVRPGQPIPDEELENDAIDALEVDGELDVVALVEDEVLLALPIAPRHEDCEPPRPEGGTGRESPFAALASLRRDGS